MTIIIYILIMKGTTSKPKTGTSSKSGTSGTSTNPSSSSTASKGATAATSSSGQRNPSGASKCPPRQKGYARSFRQCLIIL